ncbi:sulfite oxidase [Halococcus sediminicola]|uniref:sulfite oxidase n=1 Tax=Halococcus sediminicola TaxID=1264579 RepID=UPI0006798FE0|nr:sulfite oxidase [Halococcus sediminicola]
MSDAREGRREEIEAILDRKPGTSETRDETERYTAVGAASRATFGNWLTPIEEHFVLHRNPIPDGDADSWTITLVDDGETELSLAELIEELPTVAVAHTMECAGNGRGQHDPETGNVQWDCEAAGTALWTGTPVSSVLRAAGVDVDTDEDRWLTAIGADSTDEEAFARSIPLSKALDDCVLAHGMNGQPLPDEHGHPVRLVVPGWYGVNSVKWLSELRVMDGMVREGSLDRPGSHARWQQDEYRIHAAGEEPAENETVETTGTWAQLEAGGTAPYTFDETVMSLVGRPTGEDARTQGTIEVRGVAWAGDERVERVELSTDDGDSWHDAELFGPDYRGAWRLFRYDWEADPGEHRLLSRASDERGRTQPETIGTPEESFDALDDGRYPWNEGGYAANAFRPNGVTVEVTD